MYGIVFYCTVEYSKIYLKKKNSHRFLLDLLFKQISDYHFLISALGTFGSFTLVYCRNAWAFIFPAHDLMQMFVSFYRDLDFSCNLKESDGESLKIL